MVLTRRDFSPLSCPLSSYLQLLEVLLLHLLLCDRVRLVLDLVDLLRRAVGLNLRHYPGVEETCEAQLERRRFDVASSCWLTDRPSSRSGSQPTSQQPYFTLPNRVDTALKDGRSSGVASDDRRAATRRDFDETWLSNSANVETWAKGQWLSFIPFKITIYCLFKFGGSDPSWRPEAE